MIAGALLPRASAPPGVIALRRATELDASRVLAWNNAPDVRARSIDPRPITAAGHARWFAARLRDTRGGFWIVLLDGMPVGVVRIDRPADDAAAAAPSSSPGGAARPRRDTREARVRRASRSDQPVGRISIVLDPSARGRGLGRRVIALACAADGGPIEAEILADNRVSRAAFEAVGFVAQPDPPAAATTPALRPLVRYLWRPRRVPVL